MAVQRALRLTKRLSLNLNFSSFNRVSLLLISIGHPIVLMRLGGPRSRPYRLLLEKFLGYCGESNPGSLGWQTDVLITILKRWLIIIIILLILLLLS